RSPPTDRGARAPARCQRAPAAPSLSDPPDPPCGVPVRHPLQDQEPLGQANQAIEVVRDGAAGLGELISAPDILLALAVLGATHYLVRATVAAVRALARRMPRHRVALLQL